MLKGKENKCEDEYKNEVDCINRKEWMDLIQDFDDASRYQLWLGETDENHRRSLSHIVLRKNGDAVAIAQLNFREIPIIKAGVATLYWGPLWRKSNGEADVGILDKILQGIKSEYVIKRGCVLRIWPAGFNQVNETLSILKKHGFRLNKGVLPYRTFLLDLSRPLDEIRRNFEQKWRNQLNIAEKNNLNIFIGIDDTKFEIFVDMLQETIKRKNFLPGVDFRFFQNSQRGLPDFLKMRVFICEKEGEPIAAGVFSGVGKTGIYLLGATTDKGLKMKGSYLVQWEAIKWLKTNGCKMYDLGGIDPKKNPGVYHFKSGIAGKGRLEVAHVGQYYSVSNPVSAALNILISRTEQIRSKIRKIIRQK